MITKFAFSNCEIVDRGYLWRLGRWIEVQKFYLALLSFTQPADILTNINNCSKSLPYLLPSVCFSSRNW